MWGGSCSEQSGVAGGIDAVGIRRRSVAPCRGREPEAAPAVGGGGLFGFGFGGGGLAGLGEPALEHGVAGRRDPLVAGVYALGRAGGHLSQPLGRGLAYQAGHRLLEQPHQRRLGKVPGHHRRRGPPGVYGVDHGPHVGHGGGHHHSASSAAAAEASGISLAPSICARRGASGPDSTTAAGLIGSPPETGPVDTAHRGYARLPIGQARRPRGPGNEGKSQMAYSQIKKLRSAARRDADGDKGFTLVELMVVVLVIAILLAIAIPTFLGARERSQDRAAQSNLRNALTAAKVAYSNDGDYSQASNTDLVSIEPRLSYQPAGTVSDEENEISVSNMSRTGTWVSTGNARCFSDSTNLINTTHTTAAACNGATGHTWHAAFCQAGTGAAREILRSATTSTVCTSGTPTIWSGAVWSKSETCWFITDDSESTGSTAGTRYGDGTSASSCTGTTAQTSATGTDW